MFITVKFGEGEEALFNPNCQIFHLLQDIKRRCNCSREVQVDLSDVNGSVRCLIDNQKSNASDFLKEREMFILVRVEKIEGNERPIYTPLLKDADFVTSEFLESLSRLPSGGSLETIGRQSKHGRQGTKSKMSKPHLSLNSSLNGSLASNLKTSTGKQRRVSQYKR
ncbi:uncharacterized protein LOC110249237 [Exaiptasia diaphana]|uniref:Uncharacterized protein n=1 Tax=Exaiptasia diaphana TaxID=2652724 RepID=A0A913XXT6_EXADI|nr:uncharacterized protein LOC110249237 [Exaiptasia diaphana]KXJ24019.1 Uncharacterized protein C22orf15 [Exaiptasia diaphana]